MSTTTTTVRTLPSTQARVTNRLSELPWWLLFVLLAGVFMVYKFTTDQTYQDILFTLAVGLRLTITITMIAYVISMVLGLISALGQLSKNLLIRNIALLYVQLVRGIPIIVQIFYVALVLIPLSITGINALGNFLAAQGLLAPENSLTNLDPRDIDYIARGVIALSFAYGAFSSEIFRAGIQSIEKGQIEASHALGLNWFKTMRLVVLPQAFRRILPPLGNDFIAMLKDSSLLSVLGVGEITQLGKKYSAASFLFPETYNTVAFLYLSMTLVLSMFVQFIERKMKIGEER